MNLHHHALSKQALPSNSIKKALNITEALNISTPVRCSFAVYSDLFYCFALNRINLATLQSVWPFISLLDKMPRA